ELTGRCHLLRGEYGPALRSLAGVNDACFQGGFPRAALGALLNQAQVLILVNQVSLAEEVLLEAAGLADVLGEGAGRIDWLARLADARARSTVEGVAVAPPVIEMQQGRESADSPAVDGLPPPDPRPAANYLAFFSDRALALQWALAQGDLPGAQ